MDNTELTTYAYLCHVKRFLIAPVFCLLLGSGCNNCRRIDCDACPPQAANDQYLVEFDSLGSTGFRVDELDSVYIYRYDRDMKVIDTVRWGLFRSDMNDRRWNLLRGGAFDDLHTRNFRASFYRLQLEGLAKAYVFRDFDVQFTPKDPKSCCACDQSDVQGVTMNDTVYNIAQLPLKVKK